MTYLELPYCLFVQCLFLSNSKMTVVTDEYILRVLPDPYSMFIALILSVKVVFFTNLVIGCFEQRRRAAKSIANVKR